MIRSSGELQSAMSKRLTRGILPLSALLAAAFICVENLRFLRTTMSRL